MVDITKIVEKGIKDQKKSPQKEKKSSLVEKKTSEEPKTALDNLFGDKNPNPEENSQEGVEFSKKLGDLFGVDEENDG